MRAGICPLLGKEGWVNVRAVNCPLLGNERRVNVRAGNCPVGNCPGGSFSYTQLTPTQQSWECAHHENIPI